MDKMKATIIALEKGDFQPLLNLLETLTGDTFEVIQSYQNALWIQGESNELYLKSHFPLKLVIARISIEKARIGIGSEILSWLEGYAVDKGFTSIMIESSLTPDMHGFASKHQFTPLLHTGMEMEGIFMGNWERVCKV
jgi:hypothetical protein